MAGSPFRLMSCSLCTSPAYEWTLANCHTADETRSAGAMCAPLPLLLALALVV
jgi:hypothetical protein